MLWLGWEARSENGMATDFEKKVREDAAGSSSSENGIGREVSAERKASNAVQPLFLVT